MKNFYTFALLLAFPILLFSQQHTNFPPHRAGTDFKSYISRDSIIFKVGQQLEIGLPYSGNTFTFITQGTEPTAAHISGKIISIHKLKSVGNKRTGYKMYATARGFGLVPIEIDIEQALKTNEIILIE